MEWENSRRSDNIEDVRGQGGGGGGGFGIPIGGGGLGIGAIIILSLIGYALHLIITAIGRRLVFWTKSNSSVAGGS